MEVLKKVAYRHGLVCLLHEKPFAGVNGSGKHNNWSIITDDGQNLLDPGKTPHDNIQFLLVLGAIMKAVHTHSDLLRESASCVGNDHRLGANEAPPAVISMFLGEQLEDVVMQLIDTGDATSSIQKGKLKTGASTLPDLNKDATDRNRTSPFAFTGNKFEFRMVGSSDSIAPANVVLNTIAAESFKEIADELEKAENFDMALHDMIKKLFTEHHKIVFNGNGYTDEWIEEAARRGLPNIPSMVDAVSSLVTPKAVSLFESFGVFTEAELKSRAEIKYEAYAKAINIEAKSMIDIAGKQIIPSVISYTTELANSVLAVSEAGADASTQKELLDTVAGYLKAMKAGLAELEKVTEKAAAIEDVAKQATFFRDTVKAAMADLRTPADKLEMIVDKEYWPFPSYGDLIFEV
jgi:glutamine synthetase